MRLSEKVRTERTAHYCALIESIVAGRRWIVADAIEVSASKIGEKLLSFGAEAILVVAANRGTGEIAQDPRMSSVTMPFEASSMQDGIHRTDALLQDLPDDARAKIEAFDPRHTAHVLGPIWMSGSEIAGRSVLGARPKSWQAYEDKMIAAALWQRAGITQAPSQIVPTRLADLRAASEVLDQGMGTVWVGDNTEGWHGGANLLRWVRRPQDMDAAHTFLAKHTRRCRVMPFIDGIPCSIHAFVTANMVCPIRPCEMLIYRQSDSSVLRYSGASTNWRPSESQSSQMVQAVIKVGQVLRSEVNYRGSFTLDGICNQDGFFPTEVNPRFGGALGRMSAATPDLPILMLHHAMASGVALDYRADELAELIATEAEAIPRLRGMMIFDGISGIPQASTPIALRDGTWQVTDDEDGAQGKIEIGPSASGLIVFSTINPGVIPHGQSAAPAIATTLMLAGNHWGLDMAPLIAAPDLR
jgi:hypothetical protein